ncbi:DNA repair protein RecO [Sphingorhabdus lutea]|uniref:DNA repair protein RecO n=1 Tax=Sphingorhabdus lutea TaxID=1913578 RepID=A0A1L3JBM8_9SPHN|nr:DNA repair protein RecO [Sphingorhabdus lutea]APG62544.1 DNA repair protein RecO [Sphingorhabdus lutea]
MFHLSCHAIICSVLHHGENGAIVRVLTEEEGLIAAYVRGARSTRMRPILIPTNIVQADIRARNDSGMPSMTVELLESRGPWINEPLAASALSWSSALVATALPEHNPYPRIKFAFDALLSAICHAPSARRWAVAMVKFEKLLLNEVGFGLDLSQCAVTSICDDLLYVSPKTGRAVSQYAAKGREHLLLPLPEFLMDDQITQPDWSEIMNGFTLTGHFIRRFVEEEKAKSVFSEREMLISRLNRAIA